MIKFMSAHKVLQIFILHFRQDVVMWFIKKKVVSSLIKLNNSDKTCDTYTLANNDMQIFEEIDDDLLQVVTRLKILHIH